MGLWCGGQDRSLDYMRGVEAWLERQDVTHTFRVADDLPHAYAPSEYDGMIGWLLQHSRVRHPSHFRFTSDSRYYPGRNGIEMNMERIARGEARQASLICHIDGRTVRIDTLNATGIRVDCARLGLHGDDPVTIIWNGAEIHHGAPDVIFAPEKFKLRTHPPVD